MRLSFRPRETGIRSGVPLSSALGGRPTHAIPAGLVASWNPKRAVPLIRDNSFCSLRLSNTLPSGPRRKGVIVAIRTASLDGHAVKPADETKGTHGGHPSLLDTAKTCRGRRPRAEETPRAAHRSKRICMGRGHRRRVHCVSRLDGVTPTADLPVSDPVRGYAFTSLLFSPEPV
ncbi:hypothetical protein HPB47_004812 [Ixodes persulcatus]|uniref:Uncharacterized protein n=1 Tax=Ixodes persulcatus TaxID=34615 RepID=A0AC60PEK9_IXOPE|nr:hypothetical protein HPB47_004812 [Ixodes persulcatus]